MSTFNQNNQNANIGKQYNITGDINIGQANTSAAAISELKKLLQEVTRATNQGVIDPENAIDIESKIKKAVIQAEKPQPDKQVILENINGAKTLIDGLSSAAGLIPVFVQAVEMVKKLF